MGNTLKILWCYTPGYHHKNSESNIEAAENSIFKSIITFLQRKSVKGSLMRGEVWVGSDLIWLSPKGTLLQTIGPFTDRGPMLRAIVGFKSRLCNEQKRPKLQK